MAIDKENNQFGDASRIRVEAVGKPGHRQFRIVIESGSAFAVLWLEKEQLQQLAVYIQELVDSVEEDKKKKCESSAHSESRMFSEQVEFKVGKLRIEHDASSNLLLIMAYDIDAEPQKKEEESADLMVWVTLEQAMEFAENAMKVCAAGRPVCLLCGKSIGSDGHICPKANGHGVLDI